MVSEHCFLTARQIEEDLVTRDSSRQASGYASMSHIQAGFEYLQRYSEVQIVPCISLRSIEICKYLNT